MSDEYDVGYGKPPRNSQFKKGQSGNPGGRPRGVKNFKTDLKEELEELVQITEGSNTSVISKQRAILKRTIEKGLKGDMRAVDLIIKWITIFLQIDEEREDDKQQMSTNDRAILERFIAARISASKIKRKENNNEGGKA